MAVDLSMVEGGTSRADRTSYAALVGVKMVIEADTGTPAGDSYEPMGSDGNDLATDGSIKHEAGTQPQNNGGSCHIGGAGGNTCHLYLAFVGGLILLTLRRRRLSY
jgi:hypothetical protein